MRKELEFTMKIALVCKLFRSGMLTEKEFEKVRRKLTESNFSSVNGDDYNRIPA